MFKKPIAINNLHKILLDDYLNLLSGTIKLCTGANVSRFKDWVDICNIIIKHHNGYKKEIEPGNYFDFLAIIPTNMSIMTTGFLAGMETKRNAKTIRAYRFMLTESSHDLVEKLEKLKTPDYE